jgi:hypothetical protein
LVLPQISIQAKLLWTTEDLISLQSHIIDPIVVYFEEQDQTVVSISVKSDDVASGSINTILVEVIVSDNDGNQDPLSMGMVIEKVDGAFPLWEQESIGP